MTMLRFIIAAYLALSGVALAQYLGGYSGIYNLGTSGGSGPPPACSNKLDFSQACNSQYIPAVF